MVINPTYLGHVMTYTAHERLRFPESDAPHENKVDRPALFPPTFLYTQSWEDPDPDMEVSKRVRCMLGF